MKIIGKFLIRIIFFLSLVSIIFFLHFETLKSFFLTNQTLNTVILAVISAGIIYIFKQLINIKNELYWLNNVFKTSASTKLSIKSPNLLKYLDNYLKEHSGKFIFTQTFKISSVSASRPLAFLNNFIFAAISNNLASYFSASSESRIILCSANSSVTL